MRQRGWVAFAIFVLLSSLLTYAAAKPGLALALGDAAQSTIEVSSATMTAGGSVTITVTTMVAGVTAYDVDDDVAIFTDRSVVALSVSDVGDGTYTASLTDTVARTHTITAYLNEALITTGNPSVEFVPAAVASFTFSTVDDVVAGATIPNITVSAFDAYGNAATNYDFSTADVTSSLGDAPNGCTGCTVDLGTLVDNGNGTATLSGVVGYEADSGETITVTDSATNASNTFTVAPAAVASFTFSTVNDVVAGATIPDITISAFDAYGNAATNYDFSTADVTSDLNGSPTGCPGPADPCTALDGTLTNIPGTGTAILSGAVGYKAESGRTITVADSATFASDDTDPFTVLPGALHRYVWDAIIESPKTAGGTFPISATAYDQYDNVKTNYDATGAQLTSTLTNSPNGEPKVVPLNLTWSSGIGSANVKPVRATSYVAGAYTADQTFTITSSIADGSKTATTDAFGVQAAALNDLSFAPVSLSPDTFAGGQPIDTKVGAKMYSACTPAAVGSVDPCTTASTAIKVLATDAYGNRKPGVGVAITRQPVSPTVGIGSLAGTASGTSSVGGSVPLGETWFSGLSNTAISGTQTDRYQLTATSVSISGISAKYRVVTDLAQCTGQIKCVNTATTPTDQVSFSFSKAQVAYGDVATTTNFSNPVLDVNGQCTAGRSGPTIGSAFDMRIVGNTGTSNPTTTMFTTIKKQTLQNLGISSRNADAFNVCLGALYLDGAATGSETSARNATKWTGKDKRSKASTAVVALDVDGLWRQWAVPANCGQKYLTATYDPCVSLKTKSASTVASQLTTLTGETWTIARVNSELKYFDGDIGIFITKPFPWDGKGGIY